MSNNPLKYTDPTGHMQESDDYQDHDGKCGKNDKGCNDLKLRIEHKKCKTVRCDALRGDLLAALDFVTPTNIGWAVQGSGSIGQFLGTNGAGEVSASLMHYRNTGQLIFNLDFGFSTGAGAKLPPFPVSAAATTGPLVGWFSSGPGGGDISASLEGTLAAEGAVNASVSVPMNLDVDNLFYVDPKYGDVPVTAYLGGGIGCCSADVSGAVSKTFVTADLSFLLPRNWLNK